MTITSRARRAFAEGLAAQGREWAPAAASVRAGYSNIWILAGISALEPMLRLVPDDEEDDPSEDRRA